MWVVIKWTIISFQSFIQLSQVGRARVSEVSEVSEVAVLKADDAVPSPALAARYARLAALARDPAPAPAPAPARLRREARGQQFVIELAIFTDTEFHDFVRQKFIEEPDTEIRTIITNIILVT